MMKPYWIKFDPAEAVSPLNLGMGVTARDDADAVYLAQLVASERKIASVSLIEDINALDERHVRPSMGNIFVRGVWWPGGHEGVGLRASGANELIPFHAIIDVGDPEGVHKRATVQARDLADARARFAAEHAGRVISLWNDPAFDRTR
jgi:hypothetical protein